MVKIKLSKEEQELAEYMADGDDKGLTVLTHMLSIDYQERRTLKAIECMEELGIRGQRIWLCYSDYCLQQMEKFINKCLSHDEEMIEFMIGEIPRPQSPMR